MRNGLPVTKEWDKHLIITEKIVEAGKYSRAGCRRMKSDVGTGTGPTQEHKTSPGVPSRNKINNLEAVWRQTLWAGES